jgi:septum formation protein
MPENKPILASGSVVRARLLRTAGIDVDIQTSAVDEDEIKASFRADGASAGDCAMTLAELKATRVSKRHPYRLVIGADQMLVQGEDWFDKPANLAAARAQLHRLSGKPHLLVTACVVALNGVPIWREQADSTLVMRPLSDAFIGQYLQAAGDEVLSSVGAYQLEGLGVQLFERVEGDFFAILGLPLLPLLGFLRERGVIAK